MTRIRISYSPNLEEIGDTRDVDPEEAAVKIREGRAVAVDDPGELLQLSKQDLLDRAAGMGVEGVSERDSKDTIAQAITAAEGG